MLVGSWMVACSIAAREALPENRNKVCIVWDLSRLAFFSFVIILLVSISAHAQSAPSISSISPSAGQVYPVGRPATIKGSGFGSSQGSSTVTFGGVTATATSWSNTQVVARVPGS